MTKYPMSSLETYNAAAGSNEPLTAEEVYEILCEAFEGFTMTAPATPEADKE